MRIISLGLSSDASAVLAAVSKSHAMIEFDLTGKVLTANQNFCATLGYELSEIVGQHHRMFLDPAEALSDEYSKFWSDLAAGRFCRGQYKRIGKGGMEVWTEASYNPVLRGDKPYKIIKLATDITAQKLTTAEDAGKLDALSRVQAVIEFTPQGDILTANHNFLNTLGYELTEIEGRHHSMFCEDDYSSSEEYSKFWALLANGEFIAEEFMRLGKGGKKVFIQASYNPI